MCNFSFHPKLYYYSSISSTTKMPFFPPSSANMSRHFPSYNLKQIVYSKPSFTACGSLHTSSVQSSLCSSVWLFAFFFSPLFGIWSDLRWLPVFNLYFLKNVPGSILMLDVAGIFVVLKNVVSRQFGFFFSPFGSLWQKCLVHRQHASFIYFFFVSSLLLQCRS